MNRHATPNLSELIARQREGYALEQPFYLEVDIFRNRFIPHQATGNKIGGIKKIIVCSGFRFNCFSQLQHIRFRLTIAPPLT